MTLSITHKKTATFADEPGVEINKAEWNDTHAISGTIDQAQNNVAVDGVSITGAGTPGSPLIAVSGGGTVTTTGTPLIGQLAIFSASTSITNGNLSGDITTSGSLATTLATVNSNVGSFGSSTSIPNFTVDGKGRITAAGSNVVIAPAGTLSGTTLNSTVVTSSLTSVGAQAAALNMNTHQINNVTNPTSAQDAATKNYVDNALATLDSKPAVAYASTSALPSNTYSNGASGVGATLTGTTNGPLIIDSVTILVGQVGERVLVAGEAAPANNGWYTITQQGVVAVSPYILTRATESDQAAEIGAGYLTAVTAPNTVTPGTSNNGKVFISIANDPFTVGTTSLTFSQVGSVYSAGTGITLSGQVFSLTSPVTASLGGTGQAGGYTKGDTLVASGATTLNILGVGANGRTVIADSNATNGLAWYQISGLVPYAGYISGRYYGFPLNNTFSTKSTSANSISWCPVYLPIRGTFTGITGNCTANANTANAHFGVYDSSAAGGLPGSLISGTDISVTNVPVAITDNAFTAPVTFNPGWYWICCLSSANSLTFTAFGSVNMMGALYGIGTLQANGSGQGLYISSAQTFGALPGTAPATTFTEATTNPAFYLKAQ